MLIERRILRKVQLFLLFSVFVGLPVAAFAAPAAFPVTIEHDDGSIAIPKGPARVATVGLNEQDFPLAVGVGAIELDIEDAVIAVASPDELENDPIYGRFTAGLDEAPAGAIRQPAGDARPSAGEARL